MSIIRRIELFDFSYPVQGVGTAPNGFDSSYKPGTGKMSRLAVIIETEDGARGEYVGGMPLMMAQMAYLAPHMIGKNAYHREFFYDEFKRALRKYDRMGAGPLDIALWDWAAKRQGLSVRDLLGGHADTVTAYPSTYHGDREGSLSTPQDFADYAQYCADLGCKAFKMHGWPEGDVAEESAAVLALGKRVGGRMALMLDPACHLRTFADALRVGRACDEAGFLWLEDPFRDGGTSAHAHKKLRSLIRTPLLIGEHVRGLEAKADLAISGATDFIRVNPDYDMGFTGAMKVAHMAEALGLDVEVHGGGPAHRHLTGVLRNANFYELALVGPKSAPSMPPVYTCGYRDAVEAIDRHGQLPVPIGLGLGVTYDWDFIRANQKRHLEFG